MEYISQNTDECLLTAICQVVPSLDITEERWYYLDRGRVTNDSLYNWVETRFSEIYPAICGLRYLDSMEINTIGWGVDLTGQGIIVLKNDSKDGHAVSYEKNEILDPAYDGRRESLSEFRIRSNWQIITVIPINRR